MEVLNRHRNTGVAPAGFSSKDRPAGALRTPLSRRRKTAGVSLIEVVMATAIISIYATAAVPALLTMDQNAASSRVITAAKEIVDRNIEAAGAVPFVSSSIPAILAVTSGNVACGDYAYPALTNPMPLIVDSTGATIISGTLSRNVVLWNSSDPTDNPNTRRITFTITYTVFHRPQIYTNSTLRAPDE
jgi:prepilin-type N-terminal cleavage/methylation domain-containing protein